MAQRFSAEFQHILEKYQKQKENSYKILELVGTDYTFQNFGTKNLYETLINCGTRLAFSKAINDNNNIYHLTGANFCRNRICPMCQFRRSEKMFAQMIQLVRHLEQDYRFIHLVLTIPNVETGSELIEAIEKLYKGFNKFWHYADIKKAFKGCLRCLEISYNYQNYSFHPHLHCLIAVKPSYFNDTRIYLNYDKVRQLWGKAMQSKQPLQIYLRSCKVGDYVGVAEVCKYCVKPLDLTQGENDIANLTVILTLWHTLKGKRFVQKYGVVKEAFNNLFSENDDEYIEQIEVEEKTVMHVYWDTKTMNYMKE